MNDIPSVGNFFLSVGLPQPSHYLGGYLSIKEIVEMVHISILIKNSKRPSDLRYVYYTSAQPSLSPFSWQP
jgi:hypothetical protein